MSSDDLLDPADVAKRLRVSVRTLRDWRDRGIGPVWVRVGSKPRYRTAALDVWLDQQTVQTTNRRKRR